MAYGAGLRRSGGEPQSKMWEFEVLKRDSGMSGVLRDIQAKIGMVGNYDIHVFK